MPAYQPIEERFWNKVDKSNPDSCWNWTASIHRSGYGHIRLGLKTIYAHRLSYQLNNGDFDSSLHVCHKCDNRICVNPAHLFLGTNLDNMLDKVAKGRQLKGDGIINQFRFATHCKHGHPFSGDNLIVTKTQRKCRICRDRLNKYHREKRKE